MSSRQTIMGFRVIVVSACVICSLATAWLIHDGTVQSYEMSLASIAKGQAREFEHLAAYLDVARAEGPGGEGSAADLALARLRDTPGRFDWLPNHTEVVIGRALGGNVEISMRATCRGIEPPVTVPKGALVARPVQLALEGLSGVVTSLDYRGVEVLAAYEPVPALGVGVVAKVDMAVLWAAVLPRVLLALVVCLGVALAGLFAAGPMLRRVSREMTWHETALAESAAAVDSHARARERIERVKTVLSATNQALVRIRDENRLVQRVCEIAVEDGGFTLAWAGYLEPGEGQVIRPVAWAGARASVVSGKYMTAKETEPSGEPAGEAIRTGRAVVKRADPTGPEFGSWGAYVEKAGVETILALPLRIDGEVRGVLSIYSPDEAGFEADDMATLEEMANDLAFGIQTIRHEGQRVAAEQQLRASEERWRLLAENAPLYIALLDTQFRMTWLNRAHVPFQRDSFIGTPIFTMIGEGGAADAQALLERVLATGEPATIEREFTLPAEGRRIFNVRAARLDAANAPHALIIAAADVTELRAGQAALAETKLLFDAVFLNAPDAIVIKNTADFRIEHANRAAEAFWGQGREHLVGMTNRQVLDRKRAVEFDRLDHEAAEGRSAVLDGVVVETSTGRRIYDTVTLPVREPGLPAPYIVMLARDVTESRVGQLEDRVRERTAELQAANEALAKATRLKDEFLASMSHELRTPLNAILGMGENIREGVYGAINGEQKGALELIEASGAHLLSLINDILDLSKVEAGKIELDVVDISVRNFAEACHVFVRQDAAKKNIGLQLEIDPAVTVIRADERRLKQIFVNLLTNAVKFTHAGGQVGCRIKPHGPEHLEFEVWDTGIGIAPEDFERIFSPFTQLDSSLARTAAGTGLGLTLVKRLAGLHGGKVAVASEVGKGSTFTVVLPRDATEAARAQGALAAAAASRAAVADADQADARALRAPAAGMPVLEVDDNEANARVVADYLASLGYAMTVAKDGPGALGMLAQRGFAAIIADIQMPGMDGLELIRRIRAEPRHANCPIIALTALAMPQDRDRCLQAGASAYIAKPVSPRTLAARLRQLILGAGA